MDIFSNHGTFDTRNIETGRVIAGGAYFDQPYVVKTADGAWLCVVTACETREGAQGQRVVSARSEDRGKTWTDWLDIESKDGPLSSWGMPYRAPFGRIYVFYAYDTSQLKTVVTDPGYERFGSRLDTLGDMMMKYSDDNGRSWSDKRYSIPMRTFEIDRNNPYRGQIKFWWGVGKPIECNGKVYIGFSKVGRFGKGFMARSEGAFLCSDNLMTETDAERLRWETLPDGEIGLRPVEGDVGDEHNLVPLSDGSLFCTYRTTSGRPCHAYSRNGGRSWTKPAHMDYGPGKRLVKHPRAANFVKRFGNGKYLYWFHNNGFGEYSFSAGKLAANRNPVFVLGGEERDGFIHWSEPEILLHATDMTEAISYPDFIEEDDGKLYVTETQKTVARVHEIDPRILEAVWSGGSTQNPQPGAEIERRDANETAINAMVLPNLDLREHHRQPAGCERRANGGFTLEFAFVLDSLEPHQHLLRGVLENGQGLEVQLTPRQTIQISMNDGRCGSHWECDSDLIQLNTLHHLVIIVDGSSNLITMVFDGVFCDGGESRDFGWGLVHPDLRTIPLPGRVLLAPNLTGELKVFRYYNRYLLTAEAITCCRVETRF